MPLPQIATKQIKRGYNASLADRGTIAWKDEAFDPNRILGGQGNIDQPHRFISRCTARTRDACYPLSCRSTRHLESSHTGKPLRQFTGNVADGMEKNLNGKKHNHGEDVEHVVQGSGRKGTDELILS